VALIEPLAEGENGDYALLTADDALTLVDRVKREAGVENLALLLDTYHPASNGEDVIALASAYDRRLGRVQVADWPGRHKPGTGSCRSARSSRRSRTAGPTAGWAASTSRRGRRPRASVGCVRLPMRFRQPAGPAKPAFTTRPNRS